MTCRFGRRFAHLLLGALALSSVFSCQLLVGLVDIEQAPPTFGNTGVGSDWELLGVNSKSVTRVTLTQAASVTQLTAYQRGAGTAGAQSLSGVVYADASGRPGMLLGETEVVANGGTASPAWVVYTFSTPLALAPGTYWIGHLIGAANQLTERAYNPAGSAAWNANPYSDGPSNPFGTPTSYTAQFSIYATYTATGSSDAGASSDGG